LLRGIGGSYRKETVGAFTVYYDFKPPYAADVSRQGPPWKFLGRAGV